MPKLDGLDLLQSLGDARPDRSYICSGIALPQELHAEALALGVNVIAKETLTYTEPLLGLLRGNAT